MSVADGTRTSPEARSESVIRPETRRSPAPSSRSASIGTNASTRFSAARSTFTANFRCSGPSLAYAAEADPDRVA